jgi:hypothetical protein
MFEWYRVELRREFPGNKKMGYPLYDHQFGTCPNSALRSMGPKQVKSAKTARQCIHSCVKELM